MILSLRELIGSCRNRHTSHKVAILRQSRAGIACLKESQFFQAEKASQGKAHSVSELCLLAHIVPYFSLCVRPSTQPSDSAGRKTYLSNRMLPQRGTCIASFSCPMSLDKLSKWRRKWSKGQPTCPFSLYYTHTYILTHNVIVKNW